MDGTIKGRGHHSLQLRPNNSPTRRSQSNRQAFAPSPQLRWRGGDAQQADCLSLSSTQTRHTWPGLDDTAGHSGEAWGSTTRLTRSSARSSTGIQATCGDPRGGAPEDNLPPNITSYKTKSYKINAERALGKKLSAANRNQLFVLENNGDGVNILCQAGIYELLRRGACYHYSNFKKAGHRVEILVQRDKSQSVVQCTFRVKTYGGPTSYLADFYHTSTSIRVSGRGTKKFFDSDWHNLCDFVLDNNKSTDEAHNINNKLRQCLEEAIGMINDAKTKKHSPPSLDTNQQVAPSLDANQQVAPYLDANQQLAPSLEANQQMAQTIPPDESQRITRGQHMEDSLPANPCAVEVPNSQEATQAPPDPSQHTAAQVTPNQQQSKSLHTLHYMASPLPSYLHTAPPENNQIESVLQNNLQDTSDSPQDLDESPIHRPVEGARNGPSEVRDEPHISETLLQRQEDSAAGYTPSTGQDGAASVRAPRQQHKGNPGHQGEDPPSDRALWEARNLLKTLELRQKEIHACEADLQRREKKTTLLQRELTRREQSINSQEIQNQALRSTITHLERKVVELKEENQLLYARNTALESKANHSTDNFKAREDEEQQRRRSNEQHMRDHDFPYHRDHRQSFHRDHRQSFQSDHGQPYLSHHRQPCETHMNHLSQPRCCCCTTRENSQQPQVIIAPSFGYGNTPPYNLPPPQYGSWNYGPAPGPTFHSWMPPQGYAFNHPWVSPLVNPGNQHPWVPPHGRTGSPLFFSTPPSYYPQNNQRASPVQTQQVESQHRTQPQASTSPQQQTTGNSPAMEEVLQSGERRTITPPPWNGTYHTSTSPMTEAPNECPSEYEAGHQSRHPNRHNVDHQCERHASHHVYTEYTGGPPELSSPR